MNIKPPFKFQKQKAPGIQGKMDPLPDCGEYSYIGNDKLFGKKILITGGDSGIGRAVSIACLREEAIITINYLTSEEPDVKTLLKLAHKENKSIFTIPGDLKDEEFCKFLIKEAAHLMGGIDVFINCAGKQVACKSILDISTESFDDTFKTNVYALFWMIKELLFQKILKKGSVIITTGSGLAFNASPELIDYSATKSAIVSLTKSLAKQLGSSNIRVNCVCPGPHWTVLQVSGGQLKNSLVNFGSDAPLGGRPGQPKEIAGLYVLLASDETSYTSGNVWGSDGGLGFS